MNCSNNKNISYNNNVSNNNNSIIRSNSRLYACHTIPMKMMTSMTSITPNAADSSTQSSCQLLQHCVLSIFYASHGAHLAVHWLAIDHIWRVSTFTAQVAPALGRFAPICGTVIINITPSLQDVVDIGWLTAACNLWLDQWRAVPHIYTHTHTQNYSAEILPAHCTSIYILPLVVVRRKLVRFFFIITFVAVVFFLFLCLAQRSANLWIIYLFGF